jgi:hypothetical protein
MHNSIATRGHQSPASLFDWPAELTARLDRGEASLGYTTAICYSVKHSRTLWDCSDWFARMQRRLLVACRRDNITADAAGRIGIFLLDLPELLDDAADSG